MDINEQVIATDECIAAFDWMFRGLKAVVEMCRGYQVADEVPRWAP